MLRLKREQCQGRIKLQKKKMTVLGFISASAAACPPAITWFVTSPGSELLAVPWTTNLCGEHKCCANAGAAALTVLPSWSCSKDPGTAQHPPGSKDVLLCQINARNHLHPEDARLLLWQKRKVASVLMLWGILKRLADSSSLSQGGSGTKLLLEGLSESSHEEYLSPVRAVKSSIKTE